MADIINDPSKSYHPLNNYNINNPNGILHEQDDDALTRQINDMIFSLPLYQEIIVIFLIVAVSTIIIAYVIRKFSF